MIYFTSDLHLGHNAVINMQQRPFEDVEDMNNQLIRNFNSWVKKNDRVYILGDIAHRTPVEECNNLIKQLNGHKHLIKGNHDKNYNPDLFEGIYDFLELKDVCLTHISLMHYPMVEWPRSRYGSIQLNGHQHNSKEYNLRMREEGICRYDVGVDANDYRPVSLREILEFFGKE